MSCDYMYFYDFTSERKLESWSLKGKHGDQALLETSLTSSEGDFIILLPLYDAAQNPRTPQFETLTVNHQTYKVAEEAQTAFVRFCGTRYGLPVHLHAGQNLLRLTLRSILPQPQEDPSFTVRLIPDLPPARHPQVHGLLQVPLDTYPPVAGQVDLTDYTPGCGTDTSPGRFAFAKGDGLLDCAMPCLGIIDKMYLCGHPKYKKPFRWSFSTLPEHAPRHGSYPPANQDIAQDSISVNHLSTTWSTEFSGKHFSCTYSLGSPGIITESEEDSRISSLEYAGNYQYALVPTQAGIEILSLDAMEQMPNMTENWFLLFGATEFPDLPLLVVPECQPKHLEIRWNPRHGRLSEVILHGVHRIITATPFGFESPDPITPDQTERLTDAVHRCRFWSHAFMAYPVSCQEFFRLDRDAQRVDIVQQFTYHYLKDSWNTVPLELAPLPPVLTLSGTTDFDADTQDFNFPTKYGYLRGTIGSTSHYAIPFMPIERKFPLRDAQSGQPLSDLLQQGMEDYLHLVSQFPDSIYSYPFAGALLEPYAFATSMLNFMDQETREKLCSVLAKRLEQACTEDGQFDYPIIQHGAMMQLMPDDDKVLEIYRKPDMNYMHLWNWYERTEPFTGKKFHICYLNLCFISGGTIRQGTREEIANLKIPLIENDWGVGLTFYYMYLCALATGDFTPIRKHWKQLKSVFHFFSLMHDWACMGTGYSDSAILWVEGANYGAFTSFIHFAEAAGDLPARDYGIYLAAKQMSLRMALVRSSQHYFYNYFNVKPWYSSRLFLEESNPAYQFQNYPAMDLKGGNFRQDGIYNLSTEGLYPELFESLLHFCPDDFKAMLQNVREKTLYADHATPDWMNMQPVSTLLIAEALNPQLTDRQLLKDIQTAENKELLMKEWRGIHIFSRRLPKNYFKAQLLAWQDMKKHPIWLETWKDMKILKAEWKDHKAEIKCQTCGENPILQCGCRTSPKNITLDDCPMTWKNYRQDTIMIKPQKTGIITLTIAF